MLSFKHQFNEDIGDHSSILEIFGVVPHVHYVDLVPEHYFRFSVWP